MSEVFKVLCPNYISNNYLDQIDTRNAIEKRPKDLFLEFEDVEKEF
jgi:hypothetical protein